MVVYFQTDLWSNSEECRYESLFIEIEIGSTKIPAFVRLMNISVAYYEKSQMYGNNYINNGR